MYEKFSKKEDSDGVRQMVVGSGIPELRQFCQWITAEARLLEAKHFLQSSLSSLLNSIDIWANITPNPVRGDDDDHRIKFDINEIQAVILKVRLIFN